jgi:hypothetical protein
MNNAPFATRLGWFLAGALLAGCAPAQPSAPSVTGVVTFEGEPLPEGRVTLFGKGTVASAVIGPDGTFTIVNAPLGAVRVALQQPTPVTAVRRLDVGLSGLGPPMFRSKPPALARSDGPARVSLPERYADPDHSGLSFTVVPGAQTHDFHLGRDGPLEQPPPASEAGPSTGLRVGQVVPDIEGEDLDGRPLALRDYRGRVVVLTFWGHW